MKLKSYFIRSVCVLIALLIALSFAVLQSGAEEGTITFGIDSYSITGDTLYLYVGAKPAGTLTYSVTVKADGINQTQDVSWMKTGGGRIQLDLGKYNTSFVLDCGAALSYKSSPSGAPHTQDVIQMSKGISLKKESGQWMFDSYFDTPPAPEDTSIAFDITDFVLYEKPTMTPPCWQFIVYTDTDLSPYINKGNFNGKILIDGVGTQTKWYAVANSDAKFNGSYRIYTTDIPLAAKKIDILPETVLTYAADKTVTFKICNGLGIYYATRMWLRDGEVEPSPDKVTATFDSVVDDAALAKSQIKFTAKENYGNYWCNAEAEVDGSKVPTRIYISNGWGVIGHKTVTPDDAVVTALSAHQKIKINQTTMLKVVGNESQVFILEFPSDVVLEYDEEAKIWKVGDGKPKEDTVLQFPIFKNVIYPKPEMDPPAWQWILSTNTDISAFPGTYKGKMFLDGKEILATWYTASDNRIYTLDIPYEAGAQAKSLEIKAESNFIYVKDSSVKLYFGKGLKLVKLGNQWVVDDGHVGYTETAPAFELLAEDRLQLKNDRTLGKGQGNIRYPNAPYNEWSTFSGKIWIDGKEADCNYTVASDYIFIYSLNSKTKAKKIQIKSGTILTCDGLKPIKILKDINLVKDGDTWFSAKNIDDKIRYNEVQIGFNKFDGNGFYLNAKIIDGPDKGKDVSAVYGDWKSCTGNLLYNKNDLVEGVYSTTGKLLYAASNYDIKKVDSFIVQKGQVLLPLATAKSGTPIKIANTLEIVKDKRYDRFAVNDGTLDKPIQFTDVKLTKVRVTGVELQLYTELVSKKDTRIKDIYGDWVGAVGKVSMKDDEKGNYVRDGVTYTIAGNSLYLYEIAPGFKDEIVIPAGTLLWPTSSAECQNPIRIINTLKMTRDANDDWVTGLKAELSPLTGEEADNYAFPTACMIVISSMLCGYVYKRLLEETTERG